MITRLTFFLIAWLILAGSIGSANPKGVDKVPPATFQGTWVVSEVTWQGRHAHEPNAGKVTSEKVVEGRKDELFFRRHKSGSLQQIWISKDTGEVEASKGITVLELTEDSLRYRLWSEHEDMYREIKLNGDGTGVLKIFWPKDIETHYLKKKIGGPAGAEQPAAKPADKVPAKVQPSTSSPKVVPR